MANMKAAIKANRQNAKRAIQNRIYRSGARTAVRKARASLTGEATAAVENVTAAIRSLDRAAHKGVIHKNNAARRKSRLLKALNKAQASA
jgi:small subunit ribosomal protein S20